MRAHLAAPGLCLMEVMPRVVTMAAPAPAPAILGHSSSHSTSSGHTGYYAASRSTTTTGSHNLTCKQCLTMFDDVAQYFEKV